MTRQELCWSGDHRLIDASRLGDDHKTFRCMHCGIEAIRDWPPLREYPTAGWREDLEALLRDEI